MVSLADRYTATSGSVYVSGTQALVRLLLQQRWRDQAAGLNTAGFVSGYRGSPLGGLDQQLWSARDHLQANQVVFNPGLNEDLAATSVWGSQQVGLLGPARYDGVFGLWYGKGPGVDRCGDVFKHANAAGTTPLGGVLAVAGDDHAAKSSTLPHQSDHVFKACLMPVLFPANVQEILDLGLHGYALSRYAGVWVGFKCVADVVESSGRLLVDPDRVSIRLPVDFEMPPGGLSIRWPDAPLDIESRLLDYKLYAALAYARANHLNFTAIDTPRPRLGLVASGKAYMDTLQALQDLGLTPAVCAELGIRLYKVGMVWPLEPEGVRQFARGLEEILVIEEKRQFLEYQIKEELYNWDETVRPRVYGKFDERLGADGHRGGEWSVPQAPWLLPAHHELNPSIIARAIATRLERLIVPEPVRIGIANRLREIEHCERAAQRPHPPVLRTPYFCSGCPHNTSTRVPEGSKAIAGIGCHYMAVWMDRDTCTYTQMGGEGVPWIGQAPFTDMPHVFANLGDGTYFHSGLLAIRAAVSAKVNITYKILFNDAVAMTGGQSLDGELTVPQLTRQVAAEGVGQIVVMSDEPERYDNATLAAMAPGVRVLHRRELDAVQRQLRELPGTTVLVYDQTCAAEKRRRRKRKDAQGQPLFPDPARRVVINSAVCEGCGDCSTQSNCLSIEPLPTPFGLKRRINQSSCNKDFSCLQGLCPSLVTVEGGKLRRPQTPPGASQGWDTALPVPDWRFLGRDQRRWGVLVTGVGGTGVVTIGALLGMAAHLDGVAVSVLDMAGLAQKGGAVYSHVQLAPLSEGVLASRIPVGEADVLIGGDLIVSAGTESIARLRPGARAVVNTDQSATADFIHDPGWEDHGDWLQSDLKATIGQVPGHLMLVPAQSVMLNLLGDALYANPFLLGLAWQKGWIPLSAEALKQAIALNAAQVDNNLAAFEWGRRAAHDPDRVLSMARLGVAGQVLPVPQTPGRQLQHLKSLGLTELTGYENQKMAQRWLQAVEACEDRVRKAGLGSDIALRFAQTYLRVLWVKDEYEVARLHTAPEFLKEIQAQFEGEARVVFHFAPPGWAASDSRGRPVKRAFSGWKAASLPWLARMKFVRRTWLDPFGRSAERQAEFRWIEVFEAAWHACEALIDKKDVDSLNEFFDLVQSVKGFGSIRAQAQAAAEQQLPLLLHRIKMRHDMSTDQQSTAVHA